MFIHHHTSDMSHEIRYDYLHLTLMMRRLYKFGVYYEAGITCHVLANAMSNYYKRFSLVHGGVWSADSKKRHLHSWLCVDGMDWVIDLKPIFCISLSPLLISISESSPFARVFEEHTSEALQTALKNPEYQLHLDRLAEAMGQIDLKEPINKEEILAIGKNGFLS